MVFREVRLANGGYLVSRRGARITIRGSGGEPAILGFEGSGSGGGGAKWLTESGRSLPERGLGFLQEATRFPKRRTE